MRVLGLDPSMTNYGWGVHDTSARLKHPSRCPERGRFQTSGRTLFIDRYVDLRDQLGELVDRVKPDKVGLEFPIFDALWSEGMYGLFLYTCEALRAHNQDVVFWSNGQIKAHARESLGRPLGWKMAKNDMVDAAKDDVGGKGRWNHNEADAYLAARLAARFWEFQADLIRERDLTATERKFFLEIKVFVRGKAAGDIIHSGVLYRENERFFQWSKES